MKSDPEFVNLLRSPVIDSQPGGTVPVRQPYPIWLTGPPGFIGYRNRFFGIDFCAPETFTNYKFKSLWLSSIIWTIGVLNTSILRQIIAARKCCESALINCGSSFGFGISIQIFGFRSVFRGMVFLSHVIYKKSRLWFLWFFIDCC